MGIYFTPASQVAFFGEWRFRIRLILSTVVGEIGFHTAQNYFDNVIANSISIRYWSAKCVDNKNIYSIRFSTILSFWCSGGGDVYIHSRDKRKLVFVMVSSWCLKNPTSFPPHSFLLSIPTPPTLNINLLLPNLVSPIEIIILLFIVAVFSVSELSLEVPNMKEYKYIYV